MAHNPMVQLELQHFSERPPEPVAAPSPPRRARAKAQPRDWRARIRIALIVAALLTGALLAALGLYQLDLFLASDPRFALPGSALDPEDNPAFRVEGVVHASRAEVNRVFAEDFGRSVYLIPLAERRRALLAVDWVRDASVSRRWPNRLVVRIVERAPVAFLALPPAGSAARGPYEMALIDSDGAILEPPARGNFTLPVLLGVAREQSRATRRARVDLMLQLLDELDFCAGRISEIDVSNPEDLKITFAIEGRVVRLLLGRHRFLPRVRNFLDHYPEISRRLPDAAAFDLRLDDRITAVEVTPNAR